MLFEPDKKQRKAWKDYSICILTPCKDFYTASKFARSVSNMIAYSWMNDLKIHLFGMTERMVVHWARNALARQAKDKLSEFTGKKFTHLLWLDDDHVFNPDLACWLAQYGDRDMVSALYYMRAGEPFPVVYTRQEADEKDLYKHNPIVITPNTIFECDAVGFGSLLMRRDVLDRVPEPWFNFTDAGEDIAFCVQAKKHGIKIYCDPQYKLGHIGDPVIITEETNRQYMANNQDRLGQIRKVAFNT